MKLLIIGQSGQVAQALAAEASTQGLAFVAAGRAKADLANAASLERTLDTTAPDIVINTGAYTAVDKAETDRDTAFALNADGPTALAHLTATRGIPIVHLSTDCVFDGEKPSAYTIEDAPNPINVYGASKLAGETGVEGENPKHLVVRVSWVFSEHAGNFVKTILSLAETRDTLTVVSDQIGRPTYAPALSRGLLEMARQCLAPNFTAWGLHHLAGSGETNRAAQAEATLATSAARGGPSARITPVLTSEYPTPARRPLNARLDIAHTSAVFGIQLPDWRIGLEATVQAWLGERQGG